ncbi:MAG: hypothetical protein MK212_12620 [Saprospiraceae bacterium]|nr:hypothetical protein [Saprospiraceae bacterium]
MNKLTSLIFLLVIGLTACDNSPKDSKDILSSSITVTPDATIEPVEDQLVQEDTPKEIIDLKISEHSIKIVHQQTTNTDKRLAKAEVDEIKTWWDSLPEPIQAQVKTNKVDIEVVSKIKTNEQTPVNVGVADAKVEETGKELEKIIGSSADVTLKVNRITNNTIPENTEIAETNITLVRTVPVNLADFNETIFLRGDKVTADNVQTLQYWWLTLPQDLQTKIKQQEVVLEMVCYTVDKGEMDKGDEEHQLGLEAEEQAMIAADMLSQVIGVYKQNKRRIPLAKIRTSAFIEKVNNKNIKYPARQYIKIQLKANKQTSPQTL